MELSLAWQDGAPVAAQAFTVTGADGERPTGFTDAAGKARLQRVAAGPATVLLQGALGAEGRTAISDGASQSVVVPLDQPAPRVQVTPRALWQDGVPARDAQVIFTASPPVALSTDASGAAPARSIAPGGVTLALQSDAAVAGAAPVTRLPAVIDVFLGLPKLAPTVDCALRVSWRDGGGVVSQPFTVTDRDGRAIVGTTDGEGRARFRAQPGPATLQVAGALVALSLPAQSAAQLPADAPRRTVTLAPTWLGGTSVQARDLFLTDASGAGFAGRAGADGRARFDGVAIGPAHLRVADDSGALARFTVPPGAGPAAIAAQLDHDPTDAAVTIDRFEAAASGAREAGELLELRWTVSGPVAAVTLEPGDLDVTAGGGAISVPLHEEDADESGTITFRLRAQGQDPAREAALAVVEVKLAGAAPAIPRATLRRAGLREEAFSRESGAPAPGAALLQREVLAEQLAQLAYPPQLTAAQLEWLAGQGYDPGPSIDVDGLFGLRARVFHSRFRADPSFFAFAGRSREGFLAELTGDALAAGPGLRQFARNEVQIVEQLRALAARGPVWAIGHGLGGALAQLAAAYSGVELEAVRTFQSSGVPVDAHNQFLAQARRPPIRHLRMEEDVVSRAGARFLPGEIVTYRYRPHAPFAPELWSGPRPARTPQAFEIAQVVSHLELPLSRVLLGGDAQAPLLSRGPTEDRADVERAAAAARPSGKGALEPSHPLFRTFLGAQQKPAPVRNYGLDWAPIRALLGPGGGGAADEAARVAAATAAVDALYAKGTQPPPFDGEPAEVPRAEVAALVAARARPLPVVTAFFARPVADAAAPGQPTELFVPRGTALAIHYEVQNAQQLQLVERSAAGDPNVEFVQGPADATLSGDVVVHPGLGNKASSVTYALTPTGSGGATDGALIHVSVHDPGTAMPDQSPVHSASAPVIRAFFANEGRARVVEGESAHLAWTVGGAIDPGGMRILASGAAPAPAIAVPDGEREANDFPVPVGRPDAAGRYAFQLAVSADGGRALLLSDPAAVAVKGRVTTLALRTPDRPGSGATVPPAGLWCYLAVLKEGEAAFEPALDGALARRCLVGDDGFLLDPVGPPDAPFGVQAHFEAFRSVRLYFTHLGDLDVTSAALFDPAGTGLPLGPAITIPENDGTLTVDLWAQRDWVAVDDLEIEGKRATLARLATHPTAGYPLASWIPAGDDQTFIDTRITPADTDATPEQKPRIWITGSNVTALNPTSSATSRRASSSRCCTPTRPTAATRRAERPGLCPPIALSDPAGDDGA